MKVRWGILGCGKIAHKFVHDLQLVEDATITACASQTPDNAALFAKTYHIERHYCHYHDLAQDANVDIIYIATPHSYHFEHTSLCLLHRKHVLCEKPITVNFHYTQQLYQLAKQQQCFLMEAMWTVFLPTIQAVKATIDAGDIGQVRYVTANFGFFSAYDANSRLFNPALAGGSLLDIGIYPLAICLLILGRPHDVVTMANVNQDGIDTSCSIILKYNHGAHCQLFSTIESNTDNVCRIFGSSASIIIPSRFHEPDRYFKQSLEEQIEVIHTKMGFGYYHEIVHVHDCLKKGLLHSEIFSPDQSLELVRLMDAVRIANNIKYIWDK